VVKDFPSIFLKFEQISYSMWKVYLAVLVAIASLSACRKKPDPVVVNHVATNGDVSLTFQNVAGMQPLTLVNGLDTVWYQNANGDSFAVMLYKYYISNIVLFKDDGTEILETNSYHLIDQSKMESGYFTIKDIPTGSYKKISFLIGVDSARNVSGAQTGALDGIHGMFWDWNTGYIMAKFEGISPQSGNPDQRIVYHTGGFSGEVNVLRKVTLNFPQTLEITENKLPNVHIKADVLEWFRSPSVLRFQDYPTIMAGRELLMIADNYADMFTIDHID
jgi:hypothetical protein